MKRRQECGKRTTQKVGKEEGKKSYLDNSVALSKHFYVIDFQSCVFQSSSHSRNKGSDFILLQSFYHKHTYKENKICVINSYLYIYMYVFIPTLYKTNLRELVRCLHMH